MNEILSEIYTQIFSSSLVRSSIIAYQAFVLISCDERQKVEDPGLCDTIVIRNYYLGIRRAQSQRQQNS